MTTQAAELRTLLLLIAWALLDKPEQITVTVDESEGAVRLRLPVPTEEMGKVIGKQGQMARSIRTVLFAGAKKAKVRCSLEIEQAIVEGGHAVHERLPGVGE